MIAPVTFNVHSIQGLGIKRLESTPGWTMSWGIPPAKDTGNPQ